MNGKMSGLDHFMVVIRAVVFNLLYLMYMLSLVFPVLELELVISILSLTALLISFFGIQRFYRILILVALSLSLFLIVSEGHVSWTIIYHFSGLTNILILISYASMFSIPIALGSYPRRIYSYFSGKVHSMRELYTTFSLSTFVLTAVMAAAAFPTIKTSLARLLRQFPNHFKQEFQSITFVRPFIMTLFWTPVAAAPTISIAETGSNPVIVLSITFTLAILFLFFDIRITHKRLNHKYREELRKVFSGVDKYSFNRPSKKTKWSLVLFLCFIMFFILLVLSLHLWLDFNILDAVILLIIPFSFFWAICLKRGKRYITSAKHHLFTGVPKVFPQVALFVAIGFMINSIEQSPVAQVINVYVSQFVAIVGALALFPIAFLVFVITWTGIIPQLVVVLATQTVSIEQIGLTPEWFAIAVLGGALTGSASSPFTVNANIVAVTLNETPLNVVKRNLWFAMCILLITSAIAIGLEILF